MAEPGAAPRLDTAVPRRISTVRRWALNLPLHGKSRLVFGSLLVVFVVNAALYLGQQEYTKQLRQWAVHTYAVLAVAERYHSELIGADIALREVQQASATGASTVVEGYQAARARFDATSLELRELTRDNPQQQERLDRMAEQLRLWDERFVRPAIEQLRADGAAPPPEASAFAELLARDTGLIERLGQSLRELKDAENRLLQQRTQRLEWAIEAGRLLVIGMLLLAVLQLLSSVVSTRRGMIEPLVQLTELLPRISRGDGDLLIPHGWRKDEVGQIAHALFELGELVQQRHGQDWIKTRLAEVAGALQLNDAHAGFGQDLLRHLCPSLGAGYGVAYRWNDDSGYLEACAGYAIADASLASTRFRPGQSQVGQCVIERKILVLTRVPPAHFRIVSGLGSALPDTLYFAPLLSRGETVGVLEIASLGRLGALEEQLLGDVLAPSALAWQTLARSLKTQDLLGTTQAQARELQASEEALREQQEELRTTNEALRTRSQMLEEQGKRLQASEEELRAQAEELRVANDALREKTDALKQRQSELEAARAELERKAEHLELASRYKSEFLANMSHELRTPLNSLLILSKGLADNEDGNLNADQIESAQIIHDSGNNLLQLINDILDLSKVEAGKMQLVLEDVNLAGFGAAQERNFRHVAQARGLSFEVVLEPGLPPSIHSDGTRLGQIVVNLLSNAFKFTRQGGVSLTIGAPLAELPPRLPGLAAAQPVAFSVRDSGIGIPVDKLEHVFQAFEQADSGTSRRFGGTGLGLSIVRGMAQLLGGEVRVSSVEGEGSVFSLIVPASIDGALGAGPAAIEPPSGADAALAATTPDGPASQEADEVIPDGDAWRRGGDPADAPLLIVEDDGAFANLLAKLASRRGLRTLVTPRGKTALRIAREQPLRGILLDLGLPDINGWEVLEALKGDARTRRIPVHIISANDESARGLALGAVGYLVKPATKEGVLSVMEKVIRAGGEGADDAAAGGRRVLLVDDDAGSRKAVRKLLEAEARIVEAADAESARQALREGRFDCVILDLGLPGVSGFDLLDELSQSGELPPVVIYSARELSAEENLRLREHTESIVIKGARSPERLLDEVSLFLHAIEPGPAGEPAPPLPDVSKDIAGKHVLIVDDDMRNIFALSKALRARKLQVAMAQDGFKALAQLESTPGIDLILMDIMMPGMDGFETMRRIRADERWRHLPIIAVTAKAMTGDREKCLEAGANDYCSKPIDIDKLVSQIRVWV